MIDTERGQVSGKLAEQTYKGNKFLGFKSDLPDKAQSADYVTGTFVPTNKQKGFKKLIGTHIFTPQETKQLLQGEEITV